MAKITLDAICRETGLSKFAVSRALSGKSGVSDETRRRILEVAARLGYQRDPSRTDDYRLAIVFFDTDRVNSELHLLVQTGVQQEAQRLGYQISTYWTQSVSELRSIAKSSRAAILVGPHSSESIRAVRATGIPVVRFGWVEPLEPVDQVASSDHEAGAAVAQFLLGLGHRAIGYVFGDPGYRGRIERFYGMREVLEQRDDVVFTPMRFQPEERFAETFSALVSRNQRPTALFCAHDGLAVTVITELTRLGYAVPQDISVVGYGDFAAATQITPAITTVHTHGDHMGAACVRLIDDRLKKRIDPAITLRLRVASTLITRQSSGPAAY